MCAKEMFRKLKLDCIIIDYEKNKITKITYHNNGGTLCCITKEYIEYIKDFNRTALPLYFIPAINKQIEELGWLDE